MGGLARPRGCVIHLVGCPGRDMELLDSLAKHEGVRTCF
jgi:hypothetical protein